MKSRILAILFFTLLASVASLGHSAQEYPKLSPYPAIRWTTQSRPEVRIDDQWYALSSVDSLTVDKIIEFARNEYKDRWQKRFAEDLVQVLTEMGQAPEQTVKLVVRDLKTEAEMTTCR